MIFEFIYFSVFYTVKNRIKSLDVIKLSVKIPRHIFNLKL